MQHDLVIEETADGVAKAGAVLIAARAQEAVAARGMFHLAVSGGRTPWAMFAVLAEMALPWQDIVLYQVDERAAAVDDPDRNLSHLRACLAGLPAGSAPDIVAMPVENPDLEAAAEEYGRQLPQRFDLVHLGLGPDGHTASLIPDDPVLNETRPLVWPTTNEYQGRRRMTLTYLALARADELVWLVTGDDKAPALARLLAGDRTIPAGRVEGAPRSTVIADPPAAAASQAPTPPAPPTPGS